MEEETRSRGEGIPLGSAQPQQRTRKPVPQGGDEVPSRDTDRQWYDQAQGSGERMRATPCAGRSRRQTPLPSHTHLVCKASRKAPFPEESASHRCRDHWKGDHRMQGARTTLGWYRDTRPSTW